MNRNKILEILADPNFDPSSWLGDALIDYISSNVIKLICKPDARPLLLPMLEERDFLGLFNMIPDQETTFDTFADELLPYINALSKTEQMNIWERVVTTPVKRLMAMAATKELHFTGMDADFLRAADSETIFLALKNWEFVSLGDNLDKIIDKLEERQLVVFAEQRLLDVVSHKYSSEKPIAIGERLQRIYGKIIDRINDIDRLKLFRDFMRRCNLTKAYGFQNKNRGEVKGFSRLMCRCGHLATSTPGATLHIKKCHMHAFSRQPSLMEKLDGKIATLAYGR